MKRNKLVLSCSIVLLILIGISGTGSAAVFLHDPSWEAPGGFLQASSGISPAHSGGLSWEYTDFDPGACDALYYVIGDYDYDPGPPETWTFTGEGPTIGTTYNGMTRLSYDTGQSDLGSGKIVWGGTISIYDATTSSNRGYRARFTARVYDALSQPAVLIDASTLDGMDLRVGGTHAIEGDFSAQWLYELADLSSDNWQAALPFFDNLPTAPDDSLRISVTRAFYYIGCFGDDENDGDVDGKDLAAYIIASADIGLGDLAANFGRADCP